MNGTPIPLTIQTSDSDDVPSAPVSVSVSPISSSPLATRLKNETVGPDLVRQAKVLHPVATDELKLLLLENISQNAVKSFKDQGFQVDHYAKAWSEDELVEKIGSYHAIGIRSKTKITERVLKSATKVCKTRWIVHQTPNGCSASRYWLFLHWHQSSRSINCSQGRHPCIQLPVLKLAVSRRACNV